MTDFIPVGKYILIHATTEKSASAIVLPEGSSSPVGPRKTIVVKDVGPDVKGLAPEMILLISASGSIVDVDAKNGLYMIHETQVVGWKYPEGYVPF